MPGIVFETLASPGDPLKLSDDSRSPFDASSNGSVLTHAGSTPTLSDTPANFVAMSSLSWKVEYRQQSRVDDTLRLLIRIMSGTTVLAAADSSGAFQSVSTAVTSATDVTTGPTAFTYVNSSATKTQWDAAVVELQQTYTTSMGNDGARIEVDFVEITGSYATAFPVEDTFTDTDDTLLDAHVSDSGHSWRKLSRRVHSGSATGTDAEVKSLKGSSVTFSALSSGYLVEAVPSSAEYDILADFILGSVGNDDLFVLGARDNGGTSGAGTTNYYAGYFGNVDSGARKWVLGKVVAGVATELASLLENVALGTYRVKFEVRDATKKLLVWNGSSWTEKCSTTDNTITAAGRISAGFPPQSAGNGIDNLTTIATDPPVESSAAMAMIL